MKWQSSVFLVSLLVHEAVAAGDGCSSDEDCHYAGHCVNGACACDAPFVGDHCESFTLYSYTAEEGGLQISTGNTSWGGSVVRVPKVDERTGNTTYSYHMYAAMMRDNQTLNSWLSHSVVIHAVSTSGEPQGPYAFADVALDTGSDRWDGVSVHNPDAKLFPDGTIVIYYMGTNNHTAPFPRGGNQLEYNQRVGMAFSKDPAGPWQRSDQPVINVGPKGAWDDGFTTNPAPYVYPNGSVLVIYKSRSFADAGGMKQGVAFAQSFNSTYERLSDTPIDLPGNCEDPGIYRTTDGVFRMLTHCGCSGRYLWSLDGINWNSTTGEQPWCADQPNKNGVGTTSYDTRQRPKWYVDENGEATLLFTGVNRAHDGGMGHTWTMAAALTGPQ